MTNRRLLFENDRVRVNDIRLLPGEILEATMECPTVRWQVDKGTSMENGKVIGIPDKHVKFQEIGEACKLHNASTSETFRQVWFEIKQAPRWSEEATKQILSEAIYSTDVGTSRYC
jgi:hypothetical protein